MTNYFYNLILKYNLIFKLYILPKLKNILILYCNKMIFINEFQKIYNILSLFRKNYLYKNQITYNVLESHISILFSYITAKI